jgi:peptide/nickel transport system permease protein
MSPSLESAMLALSLTYWPFFTRIVYAETRRLSASMFVDALRGVGAGTAASSSCTSCPTRVADHRARHDRARLHHPGRGGAGLPRHGCDPADARLGPRHRREPHLSAARLVVRDVPGLAILITVMGFNLLGDGLRDIVDPRIRRSR